MFKRFKATAKKSLAFLLIFTVLSSQATIMAQEHGAMQYTVNGETIDSDAAPMLFEGVFMVPVAHIAQALGAVVEWNGVTRTVTITYLDDVITLSIGSNILLKNGTYFSEMRVPCFIQSIGNGLGRTMISASELAKVMDINYVWSDDTQTAQFKVLETPQTTYGWVEAGDAISGAVLSIYDLEGNLIHQTEAEGTNAFGSFERGAVPELPSDFIIIATGGQMLGGAFTGTLSAEYTGFDSKTDSVYVNILTTMIHAYKDANPGATLETSEQIIKQFLDIPEAINVYAPVSRDYFNAGEFLFNAEENGGLNVYINQLLPIMTTQQMPFKAELLQGFASFVAKNLAEGALSYAGGELMGWGLRQAGVDLSGDKTPDQMAIINEGLSKMQDEMASISKELVVINGKLDTIMSEIKALSHQIDMSEYNTRIGQMGNLISSIDRLRSDMTYYVINPPTSDLDNQRARLIDRIQNNIIDNANIIHNQLTGVAGQKPLLELWREVAYQGTYLTHEDYKKIETHYEYFRQLQEYVLVLQVEYYHAIESTEGQNYNKIMECIDTYEANIKQQQALLPLEIMENTIIDTTNNTMFYSENINIGTTDKLVSTTEKTLPTRKLNELADSRYGGYSDWKKMDSHGIDLLANALLISKEEPLLSSYLVKKGWPGKPGVDIIVPHFSKLDQSLQIFLNPSYGGRSIFSVPFPADIGWVMTYRTVNSKDYGYTHMVK